MIYLVALCALTMSGCAATMVPSQQLHHPKLAKVIGGPAQIGGPAHFGGQRFGLQPTSDCSSCENRQRIQDYAHRAMPYCAGPFMHGQVDSEFAVEQASLQPPHSKFHPVPTRPVFEARASYLAPQPMGVQLVPVPDGQWQPTEPYDFDDADAFLIPPPSN